MKRCAIKGCANRDSTTNRKHFYCAPSDYAIKGLWIYATGKTYNHGSRFYVCENHFDLSKDVDYIHHITGKPVLLRGVHPTLKLDGNNPHFENPVERVVPMVDEVHQLGTSNDPAVDVGDETGVTIRSKIDPDQIEYFRPLKRKVVDTTASSGSSGHKSDYVASARRAARDIDYVPSQSDIEWEETDSIEYEDELDEEDEDSRLLASDDDEGDDESNESEDGSLMCELTIRAMERNIQHYTGIPKESLYVVDLIEKSGVSRRDVLLVLRKIRHNETFLILGDAFGISTTQAARVFRISLPKVALQLKAFVFWPDATLIRRNLPLQFKHKFRNVQAIIDCFEISISKPSDPLDQALTYSSYKHSNTMKYLIASTPDGVVIFIYKGFTGRISDNEIVKRSGFLEFIKENTEVLADRGFKDVAPEITSKGGILIKPPSTQAGMVFTAEEAKHCKTVAAIRIHIERVIGKLRCFAFLKEQNSLLHRKRCYLLQYAVTVACGICNTQGYLTKI